VKLEDLYYCDAATDANIAFRFEELYDLFPKATFIYTERKMEDWVRSITWLLGRWGIKTTQDLRVWLQKPLEACKPFEKPYHAFDPVYVQAFTSLYADFPDWQSAYQAFDARVNRFFTDKPADKLLKINFNEGNN